MKNTKLNTKYSTSTKKHYPSIKKWLQADLVSIQRAILVKKLISKKKVEPLLKHPTPSLNFPQLSLIRLQDSDNDGISDQAEIGTFSTDPNIADADGDNLTDGDEVIAGTDPNNPLSKLEISAIELRDDGSSQIQWESVTGRTYRIFRSTNLQSNEWGTPIGTTNGDGNLQNFVDNNLPNSSNVFYRLEVEQNAL